MKLYQCQTEAGQIRWSVGHLRKGGRLHDVSLWLGGVDYPMRIIAGAKVARAGPSPKPWKRCRT